MSEFLPDRLGTNACRPAARRRQGRKTDKAKASSQHIGMGTMLVFSQRFTLKYPEKTQDMLGYLILIIEARMEYEGDGWLGYDHWFRQDAAALPDAT